MFQSARFKLTAWYLLIVLLISLVFSVILYRVFSVEVERSLRVQQFRTYRINHYSQVFPIEFPPIDPQVLSDAKERLLLILFYVNLSILVFSGGVGYFLAGRTLMPIKNMIDEQNRFITDASHEFRTPITTLKTEIEVYLRGRVHSLSEATMLFKSNLEEVNNLQILSNSLLNLAQYQNSNGKTLSHEVSILEIVSEAEKTVAIMAKERNITITNNVRACVIYANKQSLIQLFTILLDNAIKYSNENTEVSIGSKMMEQMILITISDQGKGISQKDLPHIFDRFYRADVSRSKQSISGYGLGLSIAKKIVSIHNGEIKVTSQIDKGTTFTIQLPCKSKK